MLARRRSSKGAVALESALVLPTLFFIIMTVLVSGMGVFRYQQMAYLAREGARYASVHGGQYATATGNSAATSTSVYTNAIQPNAVALDLTQLTYSVTWNTTNYPYHVVTDANNNLVKVTNTVTVTVSYHWVPEFYFGGIDLGTSVMPLAWSSSGESIGGTTPFHRHTPLILEARSHGATTFTEKPDCASTRHGRGPGRDLSRTAPGCRRVRH